MMPMLNDHVPAAVRDILGPGAGESVAGKNPNELRQLKADLLQKTRTIQAKVDDGRLADADHEQMLDHMDALLEGAEWCEESAQAVEAREAKSHGSTTTRPRRTRLMGSGLDRMAVAARLAHEGATGGRGHRPDPMEGAMGRNWHSHRPPLTQWRDQNGEPVAVVGKGEGHATLTDAYRSHGVSDADIPFGGQDDLSIGRLVKAMITGDAKDAQPEMNATAGGLSGGHGSIGGYLLNPELSAQVIDLARSRSVVSAARARTVDMATSELTLVKRTGDPDTAWVAEHQTIPTSRPTFGRLTFRARKNAAIVRISRELVEDASNAAQEIESQLAIAVAQELDRAALLGDGGGEEPTGLFNADGVLEESSVGAVDWDAFLDAILAIEQQDGAPGAYIVSPAVGNTLRKLKTDDGQYLAAPPAVANLLALSTTKLSDDHAVVGDFSQLMVGVRRGVEIESTRQAGEAFTDDEVWIKVRWRGDVQIAHPEFFTKLTGITG